VEAHLGTDGVALLERVACVVKSPGVPGEAPVIAAARERGIPVHGELELAWRLLPNPFIAITGTNGKTTTTELVGHIHAEAGLPVAVAGNVGTALTSLVGSLDPEAVVVCEASSFQLEDTLAFAPDAAVLLNLQEDHLDRHGTFADYRAAKLALFAHLPAGTLAVVPAGLALEDAGGVGQRISFGADGDLVHRDGTLSWRGEALIDAGEIRLRGPHNRENAMAAAAVCLARGLDREAVREGLMTFAGVPHRLEEIATIGGVTYVNDSKATNVASAEVGIRSFQRGVHLIAGGSEKHSDFTPLAVPVKERCAAVYTIGQTAPRIEEALRSTAVPILDCRTLASAFDAASRAARPGDVVLLSPGCASYDQYRSYEERGDHFRRLVENLR
jgi:UDP-N-acetylmuramoylalanine--D-glutamate ligase